MGFDGQSSDLRFRFLTELANTIGFKRVNLIHPEHLTSLKGKRIILEVQHSSDRDMPAVMGAVSSMVDLRIPYIGLLDKEEPTATLIKLLGKKHFIPLDYIKTEEGDWQTDTFNPENFAPAVQALKEGAAIEIAAHPVKYDYILPNHGSKGPVWLAHQTDAIIIPIAVCTNEPELVGKKGAGARQSLSKRLRRPTVDISFGESIMLGALPDGNNRLTKNNIHRLREEADYVLQKIAEMLPTAQRGIWATQTAP